mgnify:CR=1 FL=1
MDSYENEASKFAAQRTKLKNICEAHDLTYTFIKNSYPHQADYPPHQGCGRTDVHAGNRQRGQLHLPRMPTSCSP